MRNQTFGPNDWVPKIENQIPSNSAISLYDGSHVSNLPAAMPVDASFASESYRTQAEDKVQLPSYDHPASDTSEISSPSMQDQTPARLDFMLLDSIVKTGPNDGIDNTMLNRFNQAGMKGFFS
jgi:hypothetical protein